MPLAILVSQLVLAAVFLRAGVVKLRSSADFERAVANYRLLPLGLVRPVAHGLPLTEVLAGGLLLVGVSAGPVALTLAVLLVVFAIAVAINLARGRRIECGCHGTAPSQITWMHVAKNLALAAVAVIVAAQPLHSPALLPWSGPLPTPTGRVAAVDWLGVVLALTTAYLAFQLARYAVRMARVWGPK